LTDRSVGFALGPSHPNAGSPASPR